MTTDIAIPDQLALAEKLAGSNLLPKQYQRNPENLLYAIQYSQALGVHPIAAVTGIHVIEGKPSASAQLISGLVRRAGHKLRVRFDRATMTATATVIRADDPTYEYTAVWDMARAKSAGLAGKGVWTKFPDAMLKARAITEVSRDACAEALFGVIYTAEELGAENVDEDGALTDLGWAASTAPAPEPVYDFTDLHTKIGARDYWHVRHAAGATKHELDAIAAYAKDLPEQLTKEQVKAAATYTASDEVVEGEVVEDGPPTQFDDDHPFGPTHAGNVYEDALTGEVA